MNIFLSLITISALCALMLFASTYYCYREALLGKKISKPEVLNFLSAQGINFNVDPQVLEQEKETLQSHDELKLTGYFINRFPQSKKFLLYLHGYKGNSLMGLQFVELFAKYQYNTVLVDLRAHGDSDGNIPSYTIHEKYDVDRWIDLIHQRYGADCTIGLFGQSMGASTAIEYAKLFPEKISFAIADSPFSDGEQLMRYHIKRVSKFKNHSLYWAINKLVNHKHQLEIHQASPITDLNHCSVPMLFIHGTKDSTVPYFMSKDLYHEKNGKKDRLCLIHDSEHIQGFLDNPVEYSEIVEEFITSVVQ